MAASARRSLHEGGVGRRHAAGALEQRREGRGGRRREAHGEEILRSAHARQIAGPAEDLLAPRLELAAEGGQRRVGVGRREAVVDAEEQLVRGELHLAGDLLLILGIFFFIERAASEKMPDRIFFFRIFHRAPEIGGNNFFIAFIINTAYAAFFFYNKIDRFYKRFIITTHCNYIMTIMCNRRGNSAFFQTSTSRFPTPCSMAEELQRTLFLSPRTQ